MKMSLLFVWWLLWLCPMLLAEPTLAEAIDPKFAAVSQELRDIYVTDQKYREELQQVSKSHPMSSPEVQELFRKMQATDAANLVRVKAILAEHGWLGAQVVGAEANNALFLVIQHSDPATQREFLPIMRTAVKAGKADARALALLEDRVAIGEGRPQRYGSQLRQEGDGPLYVQAMEDPDHVDERRAAIGLKPMADYLKHWDLTWDLAAYKKQLPELLARLARQHAAEHVPAGFQVWQPGPGYRQIPLWPGLAPDLLPTPGPESVTIETEHLIAGKPYTTVKNVTLPTITVYPAKSHNTGIAVLVFPGGGYQDLAIDLEGTEACEWLADHGITGILLKYRVPHSGPSWDPALGRHVMPKAETALEDAQRALGLVRQHAAEWHIDPRKLGVLGFSAGGHLAAAVSTHFAQRSYPKVDTADDLSCRPDFAVVLYPGHLWSWTPGANPNFDLNPEIARGVSGQTPPTFLLQAQDDSVDSVNDSLVYYLALKNAGVPTELHLYPTGGHAFGLRRTAAPITDWPTLMKTWLDHLFPAGPS